MQPKSQALGAVNMKEIIDALSTRIKSPVFGYTVIAFLAVNWKPLFFLFFSNVSALERIQYFEKETTIYSLLGWPISLAILGALAYPWVNIIFLRISKKPTDLRNALQAHSDHMLIMKKKELEDARASLLASKERELIDRAKRDEEFETIGDSASKERIREEIEKLRKERDSLRVESKSANGSNRNDSVLELTKTLKEMARLYEKKGDTDKAEDMMNQVLEIQRSALNN